jgi:multidrug resistance efflux pump
VVNGIVEPLQPNPVIVPDIGAESRIAWIAPEESSVKAGQTVMKIDPAPLREELAKLTKEKADAAAVVRREEIALQQVRSNSEAEIKDEELGVRISALKVDRMLLSPDRRAIAKAEADEAKARVRLWRARAAADRLAERDQRLVAQAERDQAKETLDRADLDHRAALIRLGKARRGPDPVEIAQARNDHAEAQNRANRRIRRAAEGTSEAETRLLEAKIALEAKDADLARVEASLKRLELKASADGLLVYAKIWDGGMKKIAPGSPVSPWQRVLSVPDCSRVRIRATLPERLFSRIRPGQQVQIRLPSLSNRFFPGRITEIAFPFEPQRSLDTGSDAWKDYEPHGQSTFTALVQPLANLPYRPDMLAEIALPADAPADAPAQPAGAAP